MWSQDRAADHSASLTGDLGCDLPLASRGAPLAALLWHRGWWAIYLLVNWADSQRCFFSFSHISRIGGIFPTYFSHKDAKYSPPTVNKFNLAVFMPPWFPSTQSLQYRGRCVNWEIFQTSLLLLFYLMLSHSTIPHISQGSCVGKHASNLLKIGSLFTPDWGPGKLKCLNCLSVLLLQRAKSITFQGRFFLFIEFSHTWNHITVLQYTEVWQTFPQMT